MMWEIYTNFCSIIYRIPSILKVGNHSTKKWIYVEQSSLSSPLSTSSRWPVDFSYLYEQLSTLFRRRIIQTYYGKKFAIIFHHVKLSSWIFICDGHYFSLTIIVFDLPPTGTCTSALKISSHSHSPQRSAFQRYSNNSTIHVPFSASTGALLLIASINFIPQIASTFWKCWPCRPKDI